MTELGFVVGIHPFELFQAWVYISDPGAQDEFDKRIAAIDGRSRKNGKNRENGGKRFRDVLRDTKAVNRNAATIRDLCTGANLLEREFFVRTDITFPFGRDRIFFEPTGDGRNKNDASYHCKSISGAIRKRMAKSTNVPSQFWTVVELYQNCLEGYEGRKENGPPIDVDLALGLSPSLRDSEPSSVRIGVLVAFASHTNHSGYELPIERDTAIEVDSIMSDIGWSPGFGDQMRQFACRNMRSVPDSDLLRLCNQRDEWNSESIQYLQRTSWEARQRLSRRIRDCTHEMETCLERGNEHGAVMHHVALHLLLLDKDNACGKWQSAEQGLPNLLSPVTNPCLHDATYREISRVQHLELTEIIGAAELDSSRLQQWFDREQVFCIANCLPNRTRRTA